VQDPQMLYPYYYAEATSQDVTWKSFVRFIPLSRNVITANTVNFKPFFLIFIVRPPGTVVPDGLMFCSVFVALCGVISPRWLGRSP